MSEMGIRQVGAKLSMWWEHAWYTMKVWFRKLISDFSNCSSMLPP